jgi:hypothetical protein
MLRSLFNPKRSKNPTFAEWKLAFSNGVGLSENPYRAPDMDLPIALEKGWEED